LDWVARGAAIGAAARGAAIVAAARGVAIGAAARGAASGAAARGAAIGAPAMLVYVVIPPAKSPGSARAQARIAVRTAWKMNY
jgi:hypothetical protein